MTALALNYVDTTDPGKLRWPGDLKLLEPAQGGKWDAVYERNNGTPETGNRVYAREAVDPLGTWGPEVELSAGVNAVDPGIVRLDDDTILVGWQGDGVTYVTRKSEGVYSKPANLFHERAEGYAILEPTFRRIRGTPWCLYGRKRPADPYSWDLAVRTIDPGPKVSERTVIATKAVGSGTAGNQTFATISATGVGTGLIVVYSKDAGGGDRSLWQVSSYTDGRTWLPPALVASSPGHDLVNPYTLYTWPDRLRVFFYARDTKAGFAYVESGDGGRTWGSLTEVPMPLYANATRGILKQSQQGLIAFMGAEKWTKLGVWLVEAK